MTAINDRTPRIALLLDRSGSMVSCREVALAGVNGYLHEAADDPLLSQGRVTLLTFDSGSIDVVRDDVAIASGPQLNSAEFAPRGATPLLDAVGSAIGHLDQYRGAPDAPRILVILTDGHENASREHTRASISALIKERQHAGWLVVFLGANQDSWAEASNLGIARDSVVDVDFRKHEELALSMFGISHRFFNDGGRAFTREERARVK